MIDETEEGPRIPPARRIEARRRGHQVGQQERVVMVRELHRLGSSYDAKDAREQGCHCGWTGADHSQHVDEVTAHVLSVDASVATRTERESLRRITKAKADAWDERDKAKPQYLGPDNGHYADCAGWEDCHCGSYANPYRTG